MVTGETIETHDNIRCTLFCVLGFWDALVDKGILGWIKSCCLYRGWSLFFERKRNHGTLFISVQETDGEPNWHPQREVDCSSNTAVFHITNACCNSQFFFFFLKVGSVSVLVTLLNPTNELDNDTRTGPGQNTMSGQCKIDGLCLWW